LGLLDLRQRDAVIGGGAALESRVWSSKAIAAGDWAHFGHTWAKTKAIPMNYTECYSAAGGRFDTSTRIGSTVQS
jgi:hypothetical protein